MSPVQALMIISTPMPYPTAEIGQNFFNSMGYYVGKFPQAVQVDQPVSGAVLQDM